MIGVGFLPSSSPPATLRPGRSGAPRRQRPQSAAPGPGLAFHPPLPLLGYVGFSSLYAFAIAALIEGRVDPPGRAGCGPGRCRLDRPDPGHRARLLVGLLRAWLGRLVVLGPGRDASFMPWLAGRGAAALGDRGREARRVEELDHPARHPDLLLSLIGTFLVRSGVLTSVHAFAVDPARGVFILLLLTIATAARCALPSARRRWKAAAVRPDQPRRRAWC